MRRRQTQLIVLALASMLATFPLAQTDGGGFSGNGGGGVESGVGSGSGGGGKDGSASGGGGGGGGGNGNGNGVGNGVGNGYGKGNGGDGGTGGGSGKDNQPSMMTMPPIPPLPFSPPSPPSPPLDYPKSPPSPLADGYSDGITYTTVCDDAFSEPDACKYTPLSLYPNSSTWYDGVMVPQEYQGQPRPYRNLFPDDFYIGGTGTQCGGTDSCSNGHIESEDCKPDPSKKIHGTSWWGQDKPWPNARCGNSAADYNKKRYWCQRASAASWLCAKGRPIAPSPPPSPPSPPPSPPPPPAYGYNDSITYTTECDVAFSEPGACDFTPLAMYPNSSTWFDGVSVPLGYQNQPRTYRNLFPDDFYLGGAGTQCGGTDNCGKNHVETEDCKPDPSQNINGTSWWGQDLPWPNARCGNSAIDFSTKRYYCQRVSAAGWKCAKGRPYTPGSTSPPSPSTHNSPPTTSPSPPSSPSLPISPPSPPSSPQPPSSPASQAPATPPSCNLGSPPSYGYTDGVNYGNMTCDPTFSEPGACNFTPLDTYPNSSAWFDWVYVPAAYQGQRRNYRNLFPPDSYIGGLGTQCGGTGNCANAFIQGGDCRPDLQNCAFGASWFGQDLPWPNIRCGNNQAEYAKGGLYCQRVNAAHWACAQGTLTVITFALQSNGTTSTTGGGRRLLDTDMSTSLKVAIAQTSGVPANFVNVNVANSTSGSGSGGVSGTSVYANVIFTDASGASTFLDTVNNNPAAILYNSTDMNVQTLANGIFATAGTSSSIQTGAADALAVNPILPPFHNISSRNTSAAISIPTQTTPQPFAFAGDTSQLGVGFYSSATSSASTGKIIKVGVVLSMLVGAVHLI